MNWRCNFKWITIARNGNITSVPELTFRLILTHVLAAYKTTPYSVINCILQVQKAVSPVSQRLGVQSEGSVLAVGTGH